MAANPIVIAKANQLFPDIDFGFMTWLQGSIVPALVCAACIPLIIRWSLGLNTNSSSSPQKGKHAREGNNVIQHAKIELSKMGPVSLKEWVKYIQNEIILLFHRILISLYYIQQLCFVLLSCLIMWITSSMTQLDSTLVALIGIVALLHMGTITWKDVSGNTNAVSRVLSFKSHYFR